LTLLVSFDAPGGQTGIGGEISWGIAVDDSKLDYAVINTDNVVEIWFWWRVLRSPGGVPCFQD
jgi:hypothetical protein